MNKKLTKKTILTGAIIAGVAAIPITGVLAYENVNNKNVETAPVAQYLKGNSVDSSVTKINKPEMNGEQPPELPDGEKPEMNGEQLPELPDGEKPEMNGEQPPELPDGTMPEITNSQQNNEQGFFEMLKNLPSNFVNWLKNLFNKK